MSSVFLIEVSEIHYNQLPFVRRNRERMKVHSLAEKIYRAMAVFRTEVGVSVVNGVSESEVLVMFVT